MENLKNQYEYLLSEKEQQLKKFVEEFKEYHASKKQEIQTARSEIVNLYGIWKKYSKVIENVEKGVYTNGIRSAYIPHREVPKIPDRFSNKFLKKALEKAKTGLSQSKIYFEEAAEVRPESGEGELEADAILKEAYKRPSAQLDDSAINTAGSNKGKILGTDGIRAETLDQLIAERDKYKSMYQTEVKKNNNNKIVIESQKRLLERKKMNILPNKIGGKDMMRPNTQGRFY